MRWVFGLLRAVPGSMSRPHVPKLQGGEEMCTSIIMNQLKVPRCKSEALPVCLRGEEQLDNIDAVRAPALPLRREKRWEPARGELNGVKGDALHIRK